MSAHPNPFSILTTPEAAQQQSTPASSIPKINRYKRGVRPTLQGEDSSSDDEIFSQHKSELSKFTAQEKPVVSGLESKIIRKNIVLKASNSIKKEPSSPPQKQFNNPKEITIKSTEEVVEVRRRRKRADDSNAVVLEGDNTEVRDRVHKQLKIEQTFKEDEILVQETLPTPTPEEDHEIDESGSYEYSDSFSDGEQVHNVIKRPVFIPAVQRGNEPVEDLTPKNEKQKKLHLREEASKLMKMATLQNVYSPNNSDTDVPNDEDDNEEQAYQLWKMRELKRLKRDRDLKEAIYLEQERIEQRRLMTDAERAKADKKIGKYKAKEKSNLQFMQRYHHKGIFFQDDNDPLFNRDFNIGVGTDNFDKTSLPQVLQVRRGQEFKKGRSKYTHLADQDTTNFDPQYQPLDDIRHSWNSKLGGNKGAHLFERPSKK